MSQTTPPTITAAPTAPQRANRTTFSTLFDAFILWIVAAVAQFQAVATNVYNNAVDCFNNAILAAGYASSASASASAAATASGVIAWVSGTTYAIGDCRFSPINSGTYRRRTAGAGTTDPSADATNWALISAGNAATSSEIKTGTDAVKQITSLGLLGALGFSAYMQTADQTITGGGALTIAHGLGRTPVLLHGFLKNSTAEVGYVAGDITPVNLGADTGANNAGVAVTADATNIYVRYCATAATFSIIDKSSGGCIPITNANWKFFLRVLA